LDELGMGSAPRIVPASNLRAITDLAAFHYHQGTFAILMATRRSPPLPFQMSTEPQMRPGK
jgi:hypothetical protein